MSDRRLTLLVADDYPENRQLFSLYLRKEYDVVTAASGEEVVARLREAPVAAALLDLNYQGGMTGFDILEHIRATPALADLPTMALTAHASPEDRDECLAAGFDAYLSKPVMKTEMLEAVRSLLDVRASA